MEYGVGHFGYLAASLIVRPARSCVCRHGCMPRKSPWASESRGLPDMAASIGWLFALPLLSGSLSAATAWASIARHHHLRHPHPPGASWSCLRSRDPRGEMPVPIPVPPGLKPCTWWVKTQTLAREHHPRPAQGRFSFHCLVFFLGVLNCSTIFLVTPGCLWCGCQTLGFL